MKTLTSNCTLNHESTLADLLAFIGEVKKAEKTPTPKKLAESESTVIAEDTGCMAYSCGYAVYDNGSGRTVMWLPDCVSFTYYFDEATDAEKGIIPDKDTLPEGMLETLPWVMAVTLIGEHRIEANSMNRTGSRSGTRDYDSDDNGDKDGDAEASLEKTYEKAYIWREDRIGESPETIFIRKETRREMLESMTDKQREVFLLYYYDGLKQREMPCGSSRPGSWEKPFLTESARNANLKAKSLNRKPEIRHRNLPRQG